MQDKNKLKNDFEKEFALLAENEKTFSPLKKCVNPDTLSIKSDISSVIPLPTNSFTIEKSSSHRFDPFNPSPPYWEKKQITTSYIITNDNTLSLTPIKFHLLPGSPIGGFSDEETIVKSSNIYFSDRKNINNKSDYYVLSRNLNKLIHN